MLNQLSVLAYSGIPPSWGISRFPNPSVALTSAVQDIAWAPDESAIAVLTAATNVTAYQWSPSGFGSRIVQANTGFNNAASRIFFSTAGSFFGVRHNNELAIYQWSSTTGLGSRYSYAIANPGVFPTVFSKTDGHIFTSVTSTGLNLIALPFTGTSFGSLLVPAVPSFDFTSRSEIAISPDGLTVALTGGPDASGTQVFEWTGSSWGATSTIESGIFSTAAAFHPDGNALAIGGDFPPYGRAYRWSSSGRGVALRFGGSAFSQIEKNMQFSPQGSKILLHSGGSTTVQLRVLGWNASGTTEHYRNPPGLPSFVSARESAFSPSGNYLAVPLSFAPFIHVYTVNPS